MMSDEVSLRDYLESRIVSLQAVVDARLAEHTATHEYEANALALARQVQAQKDRQANHVRAQIDSERGLFVTRDAVDAKVATATAEYRALATSNASRIGALEQAQANAQGRLWAIGAALTFALALVGLAIKFL